MIVHNFFIIQGYGYTYRVRGEAQSWKGRVRSLPSLHDIEYTRTGADCTMRVGDFTSLLSLLRTKQTIAMYLHGAEQLWWRSAIAALFLSALVGKYAQNDLLNNILSHWRDGIWR